MRGINLDLTLSNDNLIVCNQEAVDYQTTDHIDSMEDLQKYIDTSNKSH